MPEALIVIFAQSFYLRSIVFFANHQLSAMTVYLAAVAEMLLCCPGSIKGRRLILMFCSLYVEWIF